MPCHRCGTSDNVSDIRPARSSGPRISRLRMAFCALWEDVIVCFIPCFRVRLGLDGGAEPDLTFSSGWGTNVHEGWKTMRAMSPLVARPRRLSELQSATVLTCGRGMDALASYSVYLYVVRKQLPHLTLSPVNNSFYKHSTTERDSPRQPQPPPALPLTRGDQHSLARL